MKRIKIMLSAIAVLAIVGGALAFKAKTATIFCSDTVAAVGSCTAFANSTFTKDVTHGVSYCTTNGTQCDISARTGADN